MSVFLSAFPFVFDIILVVSWDVDYPVEEKNK
jgi:hypothetical protein